MNTSSEQPVGLGPLKAPAEILEIGVELAASQDHNEILCKTILEVRKLARAEGGALFMLQGDRLRLAASQSNRPGAEEALGDMPGRTVPLSFESLVGFTAMTAQAVNVPDAYSLPPDVPFRIKRDFDLATDRKTKSVLAIPIIRRPPTTASVYWSCSTASTKTVGPCPSRTPRTSEFFRWCQWRPLRCTTACSRSG